MALGNSWTADSVNWSEYDGQWRLHTDIYFHRGRGFNVKGAEMVTGICGGLMTDLLERPAGVSRQDLYQVKFNVFYKNPQNSEWSRAFPKRAPIPIFDGSCQIPRSGIPINGRYGSSLIHWEIESVQLTREGVLNASFSADPYDESYSEAFDFEKACTAIISDRWFGFEEGGDESWPSISRVEIRVTEGRLKFGFVNIGSYSTRSFEIVDERCVDGVATDA